MMDIFVRIKIFAALTGNGSTFFIQDHHPFSDGSALKLDSFQSAQLHEKMVKLMVVNSPGNDPLSSEAATQKHDLAIIPFKNGWFNKGIVEP